MKLLASAGGCSGRSGWLFEHVARVEAGQQRAQQSGALRLEVQCAQRPRPRQRVPERDVRRPDLQACVRGNGAGPELRHTFEFVDEPQRVGDSVLLERAGRHAAERARVGCWVGGGLSGWFGNADKRRFYCDAHAEAGGDRRGRREWQAALCVRRSRSRVCRGQQHI